MSDSNEVIFMAARDVTAVQGQAYRIPATTRPSVGVDVGRIVRAGAATGLIALMVLGSVAVWTVIPLGGLWLASQLTESYAQLAILPLLVAAAGIPIAMALGGKALAAVERLYLRVTGQTPSARVVSAWRRSISDSRSSRLTVLDRIMVGSVLVAVIALAVWFVV
jgi:hypothetical protein